MRRKPKKLACDPRRRRGFTLIEVLLAVTLMTTASVIIYQVFSVSLRAWRQGQALTEKLRHGEFIMEQLVAALRSAAFFSSAPEKYGFWLDQRGGELPRDEISWVASGQAFLPPDSPFGRGLHRLVFTVDRNADGESAVAVKAYAHLAEEDDVKDVKPWFLTTEIKGFGCRVYGKKKVDDTEYEWMDKWEDSNSIPSMVEVSLYLAPLEKYGKPVILKRVVEIPLGMQPGLQVASDMRGTNRVPNTGRSNTALNVTSPGRRRPPPFGGRPPAIPLPGTGGAKPPG